MKNILSAVLCIIAIAFAYTARHYRDKARNPFPTSFSVDAKKLQEAMQAPAPAWAKEQIERDVAFWKDKKFSLDGFFRKRERELQLVRFMINDRKVLFSASEKVLDNRQFRHLLKVVTELNDAIEIPNVDFLISLEDGLGEEMEAPLFTYAKKGTLQSVILMPDFKALTGYTTLRREIESANEKWPWASKEAKAFWRGSSTGIALTKDNWNLASRIQLVLQSQAFPYLLDAKLSGLCQCTAEAAAILRARGLLDKPVGKEDHLRYKYLIDVDGNSCSYERYFWTLLSNSVVLKQITPNIQWYYAALQPWHHFIPVKEDLSDLPEKIEWAQLHDAEVKKMAEASTAFVQNELSPEEVLAYMTRLLKAYATIQQPSKPSLEPASSSPDRSI